MGTLDSRRAHTKPAWGSAELVLGHQSGLDRLSSGTTNPCSHRSVLRELPLHQMFVSQASPPHNHQLHLQFFNKLLNCTSLNDTLQIQQVLIANDGSERLSFDCN